MPGILFQSVTQDGRELSPTKFEGQITKDGRSEVFVFAFSEVWVFVLDKSTFKAAGWLMFKKTNPEAIAIRTVGKQISSHATACEREHVPTNALLRTQASGNLRGLSYMTCQFGCLQDLDTRPPSDTIPPPESLFMYQAKPGLGPRSCLDNYPKLVGLTLPVRCA